MIGIIRKTLTACLLLAATFSTFADKITYYHNDALGSPVAATDENGALLWSEEYAPYGSRQLRESSDGNDVWYTGKQEEAALGVQYFHARWYDPSLGAFLSRDPAGFQLSNVHSFNHYIYGNNNPYRYLDPNGESPLEVATEVLPAAGRSFAGLAAYTVGTVTGNVHLQNVAIDGMRQQTADNLIAVVSVIGPPGSGKALRAGKVARGAPKSLKDQAADLIPQNANKNRVTLRSPSQKMEVDLAGRTHGDVPTPHTKVSPRNLNAPNQPAYNTKHSPVRPATQQDIRTVRRYLERRGQQ